MSECSEGRTASNRTGLCECHPPYYGAHCQFTYSFYFPLSYLHIALGVLCMALASLWCALKIDRLIRQNKFKIFTLSHAALILTLIGTTVRIFFLLWMVQTLDDFNAPTYVNIIFILTLVVPIFVWLMANSLILGYWYDILHSQMMPTATKLTRYISVASAALCPLLGIPGLVLLHIYKLYAIGVSITLLPLGLNVLGILFLTVTVALFARHTVRTKVDNSVSTLVSYFVRCFSVLVVAWAVYTVSTVFIYYLRVANRPAYTTVHLGLYLLHRICEATIAFTLCALTDRHGGLLRLVRYVFCGVDYNERSSRDSVANSTAVPSLAAFSSTLGPNSKESMLEPRMASSSVRATDETFAGEGVVKLSNMTSSHTINSGEGSEDVIATSSTDGRESKELE